MTKRTNMCAPIFTGAFPFALLAVRPRTRTLLLLYCSTCAYRLRSRFYGVIYRDSAAAPVQVPVPLQPACVMITRDRTP